MGRRSPALCSSFSWVELTSATTIKHFHDALNVVAEHNGSDLRASCVLPLLAVEDVERPPEGYRVVRALETRLPFRVFLDAYRLLQTRVRQRNRNGRREGRPKNREHTAPENRDT